MPPQRSSPLAAQTAGGGFAGSTTASGSAAGTGADLFNLLDKDKDGFVLHYYEAKDSALASRLREFDKDHDGKLFRARSGATGSDAKK